MLKFAKLLAEDRMDAVFPLLKKTAGILTVSCICGILFGCLCIPIIIYATSSDVPSMKGIEFVLRRYVAILANKLSSLLYVTLQPECFAHKKYAHVP